jgi:hypothetical protein
LEIEHQDKKPASQKQIEVGWFEGMKVCGFVGLKELDQTKMNYGLVGKTKFPLFFKVWFRHWLNGIK